jgi:hypothetical protein
MKTSLITLMLIWNLLAAQSNKPTAFLVASIDKEAGEHILRFTVAKEANIKYYVIEGTNDSIQYEFVAVVKSRGNSVLPIEYRTAISVNQCTIYSIKQIDMNGTTVEVHTIGRLQNPTDHISSK